MERGSCIFLLKVVFLYPDGKVGAMGKKGIRSELISITAAARLLGVSARALHSTEALEKIRIGKRTYVSRSQLYELWGKQLERYGLLPEELDPRKQRAEDE